MKFFKSALFCLPILLFALPAKAQDDAPKGISWRGHAQLKMVKRHNTKWNVRATYPAFTANTPIARFASWQERLEAQSEVARTMKEFAGYMKDEDALGDYTFEAKPTLNFIGKNLVSLENFAYIDTHGAHPNSWINARNYGQINGRPKIFTLGDFFRPNSNYRAKTTAALLAKLRKDERAMWIADGMVKEITTDQLNNFRVAPDGLTWIFNPYEMGPYAVGYIETKLSLKELGPDFRRELLK